MSSDLLLRAILELYQSVKAAEGIAAARVIFVNELRKVVPFEQAIVWCESSSLPVAISSVSSIDPQTPHVKQLKALYDKSLRRTELVSLELTPKDLSSVDLFSDQCATWISFGQRAGGLLLVTGTVPLSPVKIAVAELALKACGEFIKRQTKQGKHHLFSEIKLRSVFLTLAILGLIAFASVTEIKNTVLAPAEVISADIAPVKSPADSLVDQVLVLPGDTVEVGQLILRLDSSRIESQLNIARAELAKLYVEFEQENVKSFSSDSSKARAADARGRIAEKNEQIGFLERELARYEVKADRTGRVVLDSVEELEGKPVRIGEALLEIASESNLEVEAWMNVQSALPVGAGNTVRLFMHSNPFQPLAGEVRYSNFRPVSKEDGVVAYPVRISIPNESELNLGERGTVRIESGETTILKWVTRRPLVWFRETFGI